MPRPYAYKALTSKEWAAFIRNNLFSGSAVDLKDGFIHMSDADQLQATLDKHYQGAGTIIIAQIDLTGFDDTLKYEASRGGALFPHLYSPLPIEAVSQHWALSPSAQGLYAVDQILP